MASRPEVAGPEPGARHVYRASDPLGARSLPAATRKARLSADPAAAGLDDDQRVLAEHHAAMHALDLHPGTEVTVAGHDADRDLVLVEWTDAQGDPRITSVEPADFHAHFPGA